jgi:hypothetical protein
MTRRLGFVGAVALTFGMFAGAGPAMAQPVPPGSYQSSCDNVSVMDDTLRARCETEEGNWMNSRLNDYSECDGDISNIDGRLSCTRGDDDPATAPTTIGAIAFRAAPINRRARMNAWKAATSSPIAPTATAACAIRSWRTTASAGATSPTTTAY